MERPTFRCFRRVQQSAQFRDAPQPRRHLIYAALVNDDDAMFSNREVRCAFSSGTSASAMELGRISLYHLSAVMSPDACRGSVVLDGREVCCRFL